MARSVAIVGAGQIGFAAARQFVDDGWKVAIFSRSPPAWLAEGQVWSRHVAGGDPPPRADVLLQTVAFDAGDVADYDPDAIGRLIVISSASVYRDASGRTLDEGATGGYPEFAAPIGETQPTVEAGPSTYSTRKVRMEQAAEAVFGQRATILRPCAIHGPWTRHPREWWFVKRLLDGRPSIPLIYNGASRFQTTAASLIAATALAAARKEAGGVFNVADMGCPSVQDIGLTVASRLGREAAMIPLAGPGLVGRTPWSLPGSFELDGGKAISLVGARGGSTYAESVGPALEWLADCPPADWRAAFPQLAAYPWDMFDYAAEDRFLDAR